MEEVIQGLTQSPPKTLWMLQTKVKVILPLLILRQFDAETREESTELTEAETESVEEDTTEEVEVEDQSAEETDESDEFEPPAQPSDVLSKFSIDLDSLSEEESKELAKHPMLLQSNDLVV